MSMALTVLRELAEADRLHRFSTDDDRQSLQDAQVALIVVRYEHHRRLDIKRNSTGRFVSRRNEQRIRLAKPIVEIQHRPCCHDCHAPANVFGDAKQRRHIQIVFSARPLRR
jgi:hypothetical protein